MLQQQAAGSTAPVDICSEHHVVVHVQHVVPSPQSLSEQEPSHGPQPAKRAPKVGYRRVEVEQGAVDAADVWHESAQTDRLAQKQPTCIDHNVTARTPAAQSGQHVAAVIRNQDLYGYLRGHSCSR